MSHKHIDWEVISRILDNTASSDERSEFDTWINADQRHRDYFDNARKAWNSEPSDTHTIYSFRELAHKIGIKTSRQLRWKIASCAVAAVVAMVVTIGGLNLLYTDNASDSFSEMAQNFAPGSHKATLIIDGQKEVCLGDSAISFDIAGVHIDDSGDNQLNYDARQAKETSLNLLVVPRGGYYSVQLSDGTIVHLNSESQLSYPSSFTESTRSVSLIGEAYFEVARDKSKPFIVTANGYQVEVLGTEFNISSYPDDSHTVTTLVNGKVTIDNAQDGTSDILIPGMQLRYDRNQQCRHVGFVNTANYTAWKDGEFVFDQTSMSDLLKIISRWYDFSYTVTDESLLKYNFTGQISKDGGLDYLFKVLYGAKIPIKLEYTNGMLLIGHS